MLTYTITLKGLKFNHDEYETLEIPVSAETEEEVDAMIASIIYETRIDHMYYKMKYVHKVRTYE